jgi:hypothetical protein
MKYIAIILISFLLGVAVTSAYFNEVKKPSIETSLYLEGRMDADYAMYEYNRRKGIFYVESDTMRNIADSLTFLRVDISK